MPFLLVGGIVLAALALAGVGTALGDLPKRRGPGGATSTSAARGGGFGRGGGGGGGGPRGPGPSFAQRLQSVLTSVTGIDPPSTVAPAAGPAFAGQFVPGFPSGTDASPSGYTPPPTVTPIAPPPGGPGTNVTPDITPTPVIQSSATVGLPPSYYAPVVPPAPPGAVSPYIDPGHPSYTSPAVDPYTGLPNAAPLNPPTPAYAFSAGDPARFGYTAPAAPTYDPYASYIDPGYSPATGPTAPAPSAPPPPASGGGPTLQ